MRRRLLGPGENVLASDDPARRFAEVTDRNDIWDQYLDDPSQTRLGICCSGGGIRSASYALGALQVLRASGRLAEAEHLAAVSGGDYTAVAHHIMASESIKHGVAPTGTPQDLQAREEAFFDPLAPWARLSPEEQNLRDHTTYLAPGLSGKAWMGLNLVYGMFKHLVPFGAVITLAGTLLGLAFQRWIGDVLRATPGASVRPIFIWLGWALLGLAVGAGIVLMIRQWVSQHGGNTTALRWLRTGATSFLGLQALILLLGMGVPVLVLLLHAQVLLRSAGSRASVGAGAAAGSLGIVSLLGRLAKKGVKSNFAKKLVPKLMPLALTLLGPIVVGVPLVGVTYYAALRGNDLGHPQWLGLAWPWWFIGVPVLLLALYWLVIDEVTSNMHLFYRERLSTVFTGLRNADNAGGRVRFRFVQPPWKVAIRFSEECLGKSSAKLPNLVVCGSVNVSDDVLPPGRLAGPFTFERDFSGSPLTGYVPTRALEDAAGLGVLTLPALIAISGAAVSPSMGKMTRPWARFLLALFNARLGVWLPNPLRITKFGVTEQSTPPRDVRAARADQPSRPREPWACNEEAPGDDAALAPGPLAKPRHRAMRPGTGYVIREALGWNHLGKRYVYVTDGGHWENLGLVELIRRGCGRILCFDAAGDDLDHFHTLSEAIELARSDLGVEIHIDLEPLHPQDEGYSDQPFAEGCIHYPDGTMGYLLFAKAAITRDTPQDALDWREHDPRFPTNSTVDQWFSDRQFESYRALGEYAARRVACALDDWERQSEDQQRARLEALCRDCPLSKNGTGTSGLDDAAVANHLETSVPDGGQEHQSLLETGADG